MALDLQTIRAAAERVARSHALDLVDVEFAGSGKHRVLRIFVEKDAAGREHLRELAARGEDCDLLPTGVPVEMLSGVTHEDCATFAQDFGTLLDVEDLVPGTAEYTLEVSSPGLERKLTRPEEFQRFRGGLVKLQTFSPIAGNRHWRGRLAESSADAITLELAGIASGKKKRKAGADLAEPLPQRIEIPFSNIEKAQLQAEL